ncbi:MAG: hypothetical protein ACRCZI_02165 [Cetobacterium sp.]
MGKHHCGCQVRMVKKEKMLEVLWGRWWSSPGTGVATLGDDAAVAITLGSGAVFGTTLGSG